MNQKRLSQIRHQHLRGVQRHARVVGPMQASWTTGALPTGKRLYSIAAVRNLLGEPNRQEEEAAIAKPRTIIYARVGTEDEYADLERQIGNTKPIIPTPKPCPKSDPPPIGNGPSFSPFWNERTSALFGTLVVANRDDCRVGFELVEWVLKQSGVKVVVHGSEAGTEQELAADLLRPTKELFRVAAELTAASAGGGKEPPKKRRKGKELKEPIHMKARK